MKAERLVRRTFVAYVNTPGGPPDGSLLDDCHMKDISQLTELAQDRTKWREFIIDYIVALHLVGARNAYHTYIV